MIALHLQDDNSKVVAEMQKCKALARSIKSQRTPPWPTQPTTVLPSRELADELVDAYLRTVETVYRVLHIPSFRRDYEDLWRHLPDGPINKAFLIQLKLVLAIGATSYDDKFSLRVSAITWVYEAQTYLSEPNWKSRLCLQSLQTNILLLIARGATGIADDSIWVSAGALVRTAMYIGLHKDPAELSARPVSRLVAEMRRRLWNTIIELALQSSMDSGQPPLLSLNNFNTWTPLNVNDDMLLIEPGDPMPDQGDVFTQMTVPIALRKTFAHRLAIAKLLNDPSSRGTYEETLKLDAELRALYKDIVHTLQQCKSAADASGSSFSFCALEVIMHRYITSLHVPFLDRALKETTYAYSRKVVVDGALKICYASAIVHSENPSLWSTGDEFNRFTLCGSGFFRTAAFHATLVVAVELKWQLQEDASLGTTMLRPDLLALLENSKRFSLRCIEAGETNIKGYLFNCLVASHIDGLKRGLEQDELRGRIVTAAEDAVEICLALLRKMHKPAESGDDQTIDEGGCGMLLTQTPEVTEDWDLLVIPPELYHILSSP